MTKKMTPIEYLLSKGFKLADENDPIYREESVVSVSPSSAKLEKASLTFLVSARGEIELEDFKAPQTRAEFFPGISNSWHQSADELLYAMTECEPLAWAVRDIRDELRIRYASELLECLQSCYLESATELLRHLVLMTQDESKVDQWLVSLTPERFEEQVVEPLNDWFAEEPDYTQEADFFPAESNAIGWAKEYFERFDNETLDALSIVFIEGDRPGSSYNAAILEKGLIEANNIANELRLGIAFNAKDS